MTHTVQIGRSLLDSGLIDEQQLTEALDQQRREGGRLGQQLLLSGAVSRVDLYDALAKQWSVPRVDLLDEPLDPDLLATMSHHQSLSEGWTPWRLVDDYLIVATTVAPDDHLREHVRSLFKVDTVEFRATTPWDLWRAVEIGHRDQLLFGAQDQLAEHSPSASARGGLTLWQSWVPVAVVTMTLFSFIVATRVTFVAVLSVTNLLFVSAILFKTTAAMLVPWRRWKESRAHHAEVMERRRRGLPALWPRRVPDNDLPIYTILIPVYREANIIAKVLSNIGSLDYPKSKLDVMLLMEADDDETIQVAKAMSPPEYVRLVVVPPGSPQTKPRACNYGLSFARGEYVVIYDAEDRPEPYQLREALASFERDRFEQQYGLTKRPPLAVVQASLYYFNADYNVLTRMFAVEYAHWFEAMLPGMDEARLPLPLGGTSNHFRTDILREMGAWDPYNVTEDADAGLRTAVLGHRVSVIESSTGEEACSELGAWIRQRTRWIKGYLVTGAVNTRHPLRFARQTGVRGVVGILGLIIATPLSFLSYPLALAFTLASYVGVRFLLVDLPDWIVVVSVSTFLVGILVMIVSAAMAATWRYNWRIGVFAVFSPIYWLLHSFAAWRALYQLIRDPFRWEKTPHGLTEDYESDAHT